MGDKKGRVQLDDEEIEKVSGGTLWVSNTDTCKYCPSHFYLKSGVAANAPQVCGNCYFKTISNDNVDACLYDTLKNFI